ncbi:accessory Sec system glycosyltransferase GtfA [Streptococcus sp. K0074]|uniref:accessory Sec system glycosyltransferase GtfA n=1 Tax=Streptococcus sp. K0074 TaxID=3402868 RepID=UPI003B675957
MTIYNINLGIGWASSGVEYAQAYRAGVFRKLNLSSKFIFTDMILADNIQHLTANIGFDDDQVIWLYNHFTDIKIAPTSVTVDDVLTYFGGVESRREKSGKVLRVFFSDQDKFVTCYLVDEKKDLVQHVEYVFAGNLVRKDYFSYTRYCTEYFAPKDNVATLYQRTFYNEDGTSAYDMFMNQGTEEVYRFKDRILYGKPALIRYFMKTLRLSKSDIVILDRETGIGQVVFEEAQAAHLAVVVHAEHYSENATNEDYILWNNYYDYQFTNADKVDLFIVSTDRQKEVLEQQFAHYTTHAPKIVTIPVGSVDELTKPQESRKPFSLITASRLAKEKHIDWLVKAVIEAHKELPELTFDIYGSGGEDSLLREIIANHQAEDYIQLKGHAELSQIYSRYEVYLTASTSEGFGLTLMEAISSGLPLIGFDVPYGNQTFIEDGKNGYLIPSSFDHVEDEIKKAFSTKICQLYQENRLADMRANSYQIAEGFLTKEILEKWKKTVEEVLHD